MTRRLTWISIASFCAALVFLPLGSSAMAQCQLEIVTEPDRATVVFDGVSRGVSPVTIMTDGGEHLLAVTREGYFDARITVDVPEKAATHVEEVVLEQITGLVLVRSVPSGASVYIEGSFKGKTPTLISDLTQDKYRVRIAKKGHVEVTSDLVVVDRTPQLVKATLRTDSAAISVTSIPSGALVSVNDIARENTPCKVSGLPPGKTELKLEQDGYRTYLKLFLLKSGDELELKAVLQPMPAKLTVHSIPEGATVYINSQRRGATPLDIDGLEAGEYSVRCELTGYEPLRRMVTLELDDDQVEEFRLQRIDGAIELTTEPPGVRVFVADREHGLTLTADKSRKASSPYMIEPVKPGTHTIKLQRSGYEDKALTVHVEKGRTAIHRVTLREHVVVYTTDGQSQSGYLESRSTGGDIKLETQPGIFRTFDDKKIKSVVPYVGQ